MSDSEFHTLLNELESALQAKRMHKFGNSTMEHFTRERNFSVEQAVVWEGCVHPLEQFDYLHGDSCDSCNEEMRTDIDRALGVIRRYKAGALGQFVHTLSASYFKKDGEYTEGASTCLVWRNSQLAIDELTPMNTALFDALSAVGAPKSLKDFLSIRLPEEVNGYTLSKSTISYWGDFR